MLALVNLRRRIGRADRWHQPPLGHHHGNHPAAAPGAPSQTRDPWGDTLSPTRLAGPASYHPAPSRARGCREEATGGGAGASDAGQAPCQVPASLRRSSVSGEQTGTGSPEARPLLGGTAGPPCPQEPSPADARGQWPFKGGFHVESVRGPRSPIRAQSSSVGRTPALSPPTPRTRRRPPPGSARHRPWLFPTFGRDLSALR